MAQDPKFIRTVHGVGYAFCGTAVDVPPPRAAVQPLFCWVAWNGKTCQAVPQPTMTMRRNCCHAVSLQGTSASCTSAGSFWRRPRSVSAMARGCS